MIASLRRVFVIAHNTFTESIRQKVLLLLLLFSLVVIVSAVLFLDLTFDEQIKFLKDFSFGAMSVFGVLIALLGAAQMIQSEIENRTIYTLLAKPVHRAEFLWGKFLGLLEVIALSLLLMTALFAVIMAVKERQLVGFELAQVPAGQAVDEATAGRIAEIHRQIRDPQMVKALALTGAKICVVASIALLISTFATSMVFTVAATLLIYIIGHLEGIAREVWFSGGDPGTVKKIFVSVLAILIPDFGSFGILDDILAGTQVPWSHVGQILGYAAVYLAVVLLASQAFFNEREL
jgi:ABC-2 family transporter protein